MKKILLLSLLFTTIVGFAQEKKANQPDLANREMLKFLKIQDVSFSPIRDLLVTKTQTIKKETKDSLLIVDCDKYILELNAMKFESVKRGSLSNASTETLKKFYVSTDKFNDITILTSKKGKYWYRISPFIRIFGKDVYLLLTTKYTGKDWIFMENVTVLLDNEKYFYTIEKTDRKVSSIAIVTEVSTKIVDDTLFSIINKISNATNEIDVRFQGSKGDYDFKLSLKEIEEIKKTLLLYKELLDK
jgi:hypothetical protein